METESPLKRVAQKQAEYEKIQQAAKDKKAIEQRLEDTAEALSVLEGEEKKAGVSFQEWRDTAGKVLAVEGEHVEALEKESEKAKGPGPWGDQKTNIVADVQKAVEKMKAATGFNPNTIVMPKGVYEQMTLQLLDNKLVFPSVSAAASSASYSIKGYNQEWAKKAEADLTEIDFDYKAEYNLKKRNRVGFANVLAEHMAYAEAKLIERVAAKGYVSVGDVQFHAVELDEEGDVYIDLTVSVKKPQEKSK